MAVPQPPWPGPTPPTPGSGEATLLRILCNEVIPPGGTDADTAFTDQAIYFILTVAPDMATAVSIAWQWKAVKLGDPNRIVRGQIGNESFEFPSINDILDYARGLGDFFDGLRDREKERAFGDPVALWLKTASPCFYGVSGPYECGQSGRGGDCIDVSRMGLHGVTGAGHAQ
jgi:hypothetical protein